MIGLMVIALIWFLPKVGDSAQTTLKKATNPGEKVAIFSFKNLSNAAEVNWISTALAEGVRAEVNQPPNVYVLSGEDVQQIQADLDLPTEEHFSQERMLQIQRYAVCRFVVNGSFLAQGDEIRVHWYVNDTQSGDSTSGTATGSQRPWSAF